MSGDALSARLREADPSFDDDMKNPRLLGTPTAVDGPSGSTLTITVYSIDGFDHPSRPLAPAPGKVLRLVTVAWTRGQLTEGSSDDAGTVEVVRAGGRWPDREQLSLEPRPASQQDLPTSADGWIVAVEPDTDTATVSYSITAGASGFAGSVRVRDGSPS